MMEAFLNAALRFALADPAAAAMLVPLRVWWAYLISRGWLLRRAHYPKGYAVLLAVRRGNGDIVSVFVGDDATLASCGIDPATRLERGAMRLARHERRHSAEALADLLALAAAGRSGREAPAVRAEVPPRHDTPRPLTRFLELHPQLLPVLARLAHEAMRGRGARVSVNALFELLRADLELYREACGGVLPPRAHGGSWRLDNTHRAAVGRLLAASYPELAPHLDLRRSRADRDPLVAARRIAAEAGARRAG